MLPRLASLHALAAAVVGVLALSFAGRAADWPAHRYDAGRTAASPEVLPDGLHLQWVRHLPPLRPAWPDQTMMRFDAAYRRLARQTHPDVTGDDKVREERFKRINEAQRVLCDAKARKAYDQLLAAADAERARASQATFGRQPMAAPRPVPQPPPAAARESPPPPPVRPLVVQAQPAPQPPAKSWLDDLFEIGVGVLKVGAVVGGAVVVGDAMFGHGATYDRRARRRRGPDGRFRPPRRW